MTRSLQPCVLSGDRGATKKATGADELKRVGHRLYRSQNSRTYYAILKRGDKQIKRSLKTTDSALAKRRLSDLADRAAQLTPGRDSAITFQELGEQWLRTWGASNGRPYPVGPPVRSRSHSRRAQAASYCEQTWLRTLVAPVHLGRMPSP